jgi:hypothetical protein
LNVNLGVLIPLRLSLITVRLREQYGYRLTVQRPLYFIGLGKLRIANRKNDESLPRTRARRIHPGDRYSVQHALNFEF